MSMTSDKHYVLDHNTNHSVLNLNLEIVNLVKLDYIIYFGLLVFTNALCALRTKNGTNCGTLYISG